jgi:hypothetical protein
METKRRQTPHTIHLVSASLLTLGTLPVNVQERVDRRDAAVRLLLTRQVPIIYIYSHAPSVLTGTRVFLVELEFFKQGVPLRSLRIPFKAHGFETGNPIGRNFAVVCLLINPKFDPLVVYPSA